MTILPRSAWDARPPDSVTRLPTSSLRGVAIHWFGSPRSPSSPDGVPAVIRSVQNGHMAPGGLGTKDGGSDIGYSFIVDMWGRIWTGRGWDVRPGATGPANSTHGAIVYAAGIGDPFTDDAKRAINWLIGEYRRRRAGNDVSWHSNFMQTDCPGDTIRNWIRTGRPANSEEDDMPEPSDLWNFQYEYGDANVTAKTFLGRAYVNAKAANERAKRLEAQVAALADAVSKLQQPAQVSAEAIADLLAQRLRS